jgi:hypothetical protein
MTLVGPDAIPPDVMPTEAAGGVPQGLMTTRVDAGMPSSRALVPPVRPRTRSLAAAVASAELADRQLAILVLAAAAAARLAAPPVAWAVAGLVGATAFIGAVEIVAATAPRSMRAGGGRIRVPRLPMSAGLVPAVVAAGGAVALHAVDPGPGLVVGLAAIGLLLTWSVGLERRLALASNAPSDEDVAIVLALGVAAAFLAFVGAGTLVEGGLAGPGAAAMPVDRLAILVTADALAAIALGVRLARLRAATARNAVLGGASSGAFVAVAAAALRALAIPLLLGPALLALVFFLWDAVTGSTVARRRDPRWAWELGLLALLGAAVTLLNLRVG